MPKFRVVLDWCYTKTFMYEVEAKDKKQAAKKVLDDGGNCLKKNGVTQVSEGDLEALETPEVVVVERVG